MWKWLKSPLTDERIRRNCTYIYIYIYRNIYRLLFSHKKDEIWQAWMDLEGINLNEVSQMDKYHIIILIFSIKNEKKKGKIHT